jgi:hypothetical protein
MRVSENVVLREISGNRWEKVKGDWIKLRNEECHGLHSSPGTIWVTQSRRRILVWRVAYIGRAEMHAEFCWGKPEDRNTFNT